MVKYMLPLASTALCAVSSSSLLARLDLQVRAYVPIIRATDGSMRARVYKMTYTKDAPSDHALIFADELQQALEQGVPNSLVLFGKAADAQLR